MPNTTASLSKKIWEMPIVPESYDRRPLTCEEQKALAVAVKDGAHLRGARGSPYTHPDLDRLANPLRDVTELRVSDVSQYNAVRKLMYRAMAQKGTSFWEWSKDDWLAILCPTRQDYVKKHGEQKGRGALMNMAYLLGGISDLHETNQQEDCTAMAQSIFGKDVIEQEFKRITDMLVGREGIGYSGSQASMNFLRAAFCFLVLLNRTPYLEAMSSELLLTTVEKANPRLRSPLQRIAKTLQELGIIEPVVSVEPKPNKQVDTSGVSEVWMEWCFAWKARSTAPIRVRHTHMSNLLAVGRWLAKEAPEVTSPEQWDEDLALTYVSYACSATVGDYVSPGGVDRLSRQGLLGRPLTPSGIDHKLATLRKFFSDLQDIPHAVGGVARKIEKRFNPVRTFATPESIRRLIQPDPRDIDEVIWCKLTYAAATLTEEDYNGGFSGYPLSYYRASALLWVTSARRPNEIMRLQLGCIRRDWDPQMLDEYGVPLPGSEAQLCYLLVPANKTKGPYWVPIPKYTAEAIEAWERERPFSQSKLVDHKDNANVDFLFCLRGKKMGQTFINRSLIPVLCKRAGVPEKDARGNITGHRARSTIATMLRRNGLSLEDISQFLGHASPEMVRAYARTDPFRFGRDMNRANDLMRIVEGIIDTRAAKTGQPNVFFFLGRGADGQPRFCGNPAWEKCRHRLACLKCPMYVGAGQAARLAERLEARDEIFKFQTQVEMIPQERAAVEGDIETLSALIEQDAHVPPPEPPDDQFRFTTQPSDEQASTSEHVDHTDLMTLGRELATLKRDLAVAEKRTDGRNATVRSLKKRIAQVTEQMATLDQITELNKANLSMERIVPK